MERVKKFLFVNTSNKQTVVKNTFWLFLSEISGRLLKMGLVIYAARVLGVSGWGIFSYTISVGSLLMIFSDIGIGDLVIREATQKKDGYKKYVSTALLLKIILLLSSTILLIFIGPFISHIPEARTIFPIVALVLFFDSMRELGLSINRISEKMERDMIVKIVTNSIIFGLGIILLKIKLAPESIAIAYAIGSAMGFITVAFIIRKDFTKLISKIDIKIFKLIIKTTWPFAFIVLIGTIMGNIDIYMLGIWRNSTEIGLYSAVQRIQQFILIIPSTIAVAVFPLMSRLANIDNEQFKLVFKKTISLIMIIGLPLALGGILLANQIVPLIFGPDYSGAIPILRILMAMLLFSFPLFLLSNVIFAYNRQKELVKAYSTGIIANILLNLLLVPKFGAMGSAIATLISTLTIIIIIWGKIKIISYFEIMPQIKKSFLATLIMIFSILILKNLNINVIINILFSSSIYFVSLLLFKESIFKELREIISNK